MVKVCSFLIDAEFLKLGHVMACDSDTEIKKFVNCLRVRAEGWGC